MDSRLSGGHNFEPDLRGEFKKEVHIVDVWSVLSKSRKFILLSTLCLSALATIIVFLLPSRYTSETVVLPPGENSSLGSSILSQVGGSSALASLAGTSLGIKNPGDRYVSLFRLPVVEDAVIKRFDLKARYKKKRISDARRKFEDRSTVVLGAKDGLIRINVTDTDPNCAAEIANGYVDEFRKLSAQLAVTEASQRRLFFQQQMLEANEKLAAAEEAMKSTEQTTGVLQIDSQAKALIQSAATLRGQIAAKEVQLKVLGSSLTEDSPQMIVAKQELNALKAQLSQLNGRDSGIDTDIIPAKNSLLASQVAYIRRLRDLRYYEAVTEIMAKQFEMAKLDEAREGAIVQVAEVAIPPDKRSFPRRTITIIIATFVGFFLVSVGCLFFDGFKRMKIAQLASKQVHNLQEPILKGR